MQKDLQINFFPICTSNLRVSCYRRVCNSPNEKKPDANHYRFKEGDENKDTPYYWLTRNPNPGYEEYQFDSEKYPWTARWVLSQPFLLAFQKEIMADASYRTRLVDSFSPKLDVMVKEIPGFGWQGFIVEFDWQPELHRFGLYVNFHFFKNDGVAYSDKVQRLSLSLDASGKPNRALYRQYNDWLEAFYARFLSGKTWSLGKESVRFENLASLPAYVLRSKVLEFADGALNKNPYWGVKKFGPRKGCRDAPTFFFVFRREHIQAARFLFECLCGREFPDRFPGMASFFGLQFDRQNVRHVILEGDDEIAHEQAATAIASAGCRNAVAIVLVSGDEHEYLLQKSTYLRKGIPSQDVRIGHVLAGRSFQWSVAGVALQLFCKAGGIPWCVQTPRRKDLIVGISQLWERKEGENKRFVAYSITTDASGFFKDIRTLSDKTCEADYVSELAQRIKTLLEENIKRDCPERIVLHCSFRLQKSAMEAIRSAVREVLSANTGSTKIIIARVNTDHHYLGFNSNRETLIPDENTVLKLRRSSYLVWPDGTPPEGVAQTRPSSPIFVVFDQADPPIGEQEERDFLQDICNLSGANWRGFNAKARPVSVFYCHLVGRIMSDMDKHRLPLPSIERFVPWFL